MEQFYGNSEAAATLERMIASGRVPQTILLHGPAGIGKATLARRFAAELLHESPARLDADDLSSAANRATIAEREKWTAEKRNEDPLLFASQPDFVTFAPDGPLRQITIPQIRLLKERAQYQPLRGRHRVFLLDQFDRANEQAANSLLKILEEPPPYLVIILTAENPYDLLPTIRSRSVPVHLRRLSDEEMQRFAKDRGLEDAARRIALANGSPGAAVTLDLPAYDKRRAVMLAFLQTAAGAANFGAWVKHAETLGSSKQEKLDYYLEILILLLEDLVLLQHGAGPIRNADVRGALEEISNRVSFTWLQTAARRADELFSLLRRNIQKGIALDAFLMELRNAAAR